MRHAARALLLVLTAWPASVRADVRVVTVEGADWGEAVRALAERGGDGIGLCAREDASSVCAPCERYRLALDEVAAEAFELDRCDPATGVTLARLVDRAALFDHAHALPALRTSSVSVALAPDDGPHLACSARVRAFGHDLEQQRFVPLTPDRFSIRVERDDVRVAAVDDAFSLESERGGEVAYTIVAGVGGEVVLEGSASLACAPQRIAPEPAPVVADEAPAPHTATSGIRLRAHAPEHEVAQALMYSGYGLVGLGALTLFVVGILVVFDIAAFGCGFSSALDPSATTMPGHCPNAVPIPPELVWTSLGAIGLGAIVGSVGLGIDATRPAASPTASLALRVRF